CLNRGPEEAARFTRSAQARARGDGVWRVPDRRLERDARVFLLPRGKTRLSERDVERTQLRGVGRRQSNRRFECLYGIRVLSEPHPTTTKARPARSRRRLELEQLGQRRCGGIVPALSDP